MKRFFLLPILIIALTSSNLIYAATLTPMPYGGAVVFDRATCTETDYPAAGDTNASRGDALSAAVRYVALNDNDAGKSSLNNQSIYLSPGTFDIGSSTIDLTAGLDIFTDPGDPENDVPPTVTETVIRNLLQGNNLHGSGKNMTTISSTVHGPNSMVLVKPSPNSQITDLAISAGNTGPSDYAFPFGIGQEPAPYIGYVPPPMDFGTVYLKNAILRGPTDGLYFNADDKTMTLNIINSDMISSWDSVAVFGRNTLNINMYDSKVLVTGLSSLTQTEFRGINNTSGAGFNIFNTTFNVQGINAVYGIKTNGPVHIFNSSLVTSSNNQSTSTTYDLYAYTSFDNVLHTGALYVSSSTAYSTSFGTVSHVSESASTTPTLPAEPCQHPFKTIPAVFVPTVADQITQNSAVLHGTISYDGLSPVTSVGFDYGLDTSYPNTTSMGGTFAEGSSFSKTLTNLTCGTTYSYRGFAGNTQGTGTSTNQTFTTLACPVAETPVVTHSAGGSSISSTELARLFDAQILAPVATTSSVNASSSFVFTRDLSYGMRGNDVTELQKYLNAHNFVIAQTGPGSAGNETNFFGLLTKKALSLFQAAHNIQPTAGYFGSKTRGFISGNK